MARKKRRKLLSVIVPAYRQEKTIKKDILRLQKSFKSLAISYEIIVVVDGQVDNTMGQVKKITSRKVRTVGYKINKGKGHAVRYGMMQARGDTVAFIDAGMDLNPNALSMLLEHFKWYNADIIVGSKLHPVSKVNYPLERRILSWGYRFLVKVLFGLSIKDTQVGVKIYRKEVLKKVLPRILVKTYAFDIEMLAVAYWLGFKRIYEAPVELDFKGASSVVSKNLSRVMFLMLWDTLAVFYRLRIMHYYDEKNKKRWRYESRPNLGLSI